MACHVVLGRFSRFIVGRVKLHVLTRGPHRFPNYFKFTTKYLISRHCGSARLFNVAFTSYFQKTMDLNGLFYRENCRCFNSSSNSQRKVLSSSTALNLPSVKQMEQFLSSKGIPYEHGHTSVVVGCLDCQDKGKSAEKSVFINKTTGSYFCKSCGKSGSWRQFKSMYSDQGVDKSKNSEDHDSQPLTTINSDTEQKAIDVWDSSKPFQNTDINIKNRIVEYFNLQKLSEVSLSKYRIHVADYKFLEPTGKSFHHPCIVFPWFRSSNSSVHGIKLVRIEQESNNTVTLQPRLGTLGLFGWNTIAQDAKEVVLTLNEFDAIAVSQETSYPAISLPLATHSLPPEVLPQMEQFERIILWFGEDIRARQAANQFSKKLSIHRCHIVRPSGDGPPSGPLDALNKGFDLKGLIDSSKPISHEKIATFQELRNDVYSELVNADQVSGVKWSRFPKLNSLLKGHRRGELTIFTGPTGAGKTTLLSEMSVDLCQQGVNTLWGSFEIRNVRLAKIMMNQFSGLDLQKNVQQFSYWADKFEMLPLYFMCFYGSQNINTVIETMSHAVYVFDIDHVVIDNLQFMTSSLRAEDRFSVQNQAISCLRDFASSKNVHVTLVIHPRKENDDVELQTASIFGTAKASQEADNVMILQDKKGRGEKYLQVTKNRFDGSVGRVPLEFVKGSLSMCGFGKKDNSIPKAFKGSKVVSDVDMINIPSSTSSIQKARIRTFPPGNPNLSKGIPDEGIDQKGRAKPPGVSKSKKDNPGGTKLDFAISDVDGVRTFQENVSETIKSKGMSQKSPVPSSSKVDDGQKLDAKKLYSKTVASLVAKHVIRNRVQQKKVSSLQRRLKPAMKK